MQKNLAIKLAVITFISVLLLIPLSMISGKIAERAQFQQSAKTAVAHSWTSEQTLMSPIIVIPYQIKTEEIVFNKLSNAHESMLSTKQKYKFLVPEFIEIKSSITNDIRHKGIYKIPVYTANVGLNGVLKAEKINQTITAIKTQFQEVKISHPFITTSISDLRGVNSIPTLTWQNKNITFEPGSRLSKKISGLHANLPQFEDMLTEDITFKFNLTLRGMETLSFIPIGKNVQLEVSSPWPHPQFIGTFLPVSSEISDKGYKANWQITSFANNIEEKVKQCEQMDCNALTTSSFGIKHIETVDIYLQSERSVKYGMLFIGLSFISFFIFEYSFVFYN